MQSFPSDTNGLKGATGQNYITCGFRLMHGLIHGLIHGLL